MLFLCSYLIIYNLFFVVPYICLGPSRPEYATTMYTKVNPIAHDALVPCIARGSVTLVLTTSTHGIIFIGGEFISAVCVLRYDVVENANIFICL